MSGFPEYAEHDGLGLAELIRGGEVSAEEVLDEAIRRIEAHNPVLNAVVTRMYDQARDALRRGIPEGPFAGVPFLLKDLLHGCAGVPLSAGSRALRDWVPEQDSELVARYKRAGLVTCGKTNVPELGLLGVTEPDLFGPARNPWNPERTPGGSSGGSGAAVAARLVPMASATDGGGSIRIPAACCGLFGLKPSRGRSSGAPNHGEIWGGAVVDHVVSLTVRDSAAALDAIAGPMPGDPWPVAAPERPYLEEMGRAPGPLRIGFTTRSPIGTAVDPECVRAVEEAARLLEGLGHRVEPAEPDVDGLEVARAYLMLQYGQVAAELRWIARHRGRRAARRLVEGTTLLVGSVGEGLPIAEYTTSRRRWNDFARRMAVFHARYDIQLTPTLGVPPIPIGALSLRPLDRVGIRVVNLLRAGRIYRATGLLEKLAIENLAPFPFTQLANLTGQPAMSVPLHWTEDSLPCGVHFVAPMGEEALLFQLARQLEEAAPWADRIPPVA
jgi:amidase